MPDNRSRTARSRASAPGPGERITWYLDNDAQASVTEEPDETWAWHWVPGDHRKSKSHPGFRGRDEAIGAARAALDEAGIILKPKIGERTCRNCHRPLFDHCNLERKDWSDGR